MAKAAANRYQDNYDRGFIRAVAALQEAGFCKNIIALEKHLGIPRGTLYQVLKGRRGIPALHRHKVYKLLTETYHVNKEVFTNVIAPVFRNKEAALMLEDVEEPYLVAEPTNTISMGDLRELERLRGENQRLEERLKDAHSQIKTLEKLLERALSHSGHGSGQKPAKRG